MKKHTFRKLSALLMTLCLIVLSVMLPVHAADPERTTGTIKVTVDPNFEGIPMYLIEIGSYENGEITFAPEYEALGITIDSFNTSNGVIQAANAASEYARDNNIQGMIGRIDMDGEILYKDVPLNKLYLIMQPIGQEIVTVQPIILTMPTVNVDKQTIYDVPVKAKNVDKENELYKGAVILNKVGDNNRLLEGADFTLWRKIYYTDPTKIRDDLETGEDDTGTYYWKHIGETLTTDSNGQISVSGLPFADYRFIETAAPDGYILDDTPQEFTISKHGTIKVENDVYVKDTGSPVILTVENMSVTGSSESDSSEPVESVLSTPEYSEESEYPGATSQTEITNSTAAPGISVTANEKPVWEITGQDITQFIIIGVIVAVSLVVIILLFVTSGKKKNKDEQ
ncbi:MAG: hypothetical protein IJ192_06340 [Clostridia bacterium]|nr:hypothetical protein [Clostridia bacterium]